MFEIKPWNPESYRQQTRRSTVIIAVTFILLAMTLSGLAVMLFGEPGGDNFRFNLGGVIAAVIVSAVLMKTKGWSQPWMAAAVYGWQLKRSLMSVTNVMHKVTDAVQAGNPSAIKLLRFYHLGLTQMHQLDGNTSSLSQMTREIDQHKASMEALGIDTEQNQLNPEWLAAVKAKEA
ncbi:DUF3087 domain-containing protein [Pseudomonas sp. FW306-02-F02-AA]|uniref:DUF3087 domain-containing protein n=1 Tax=Pseudomonas fluorescens TaxID=294 RepID=A0A0N9WJE7_PSEFL|nr:MULTISPECIES: DUF3087 domain-containing protein [Pseudomonas]ALI04911.1 hypothetical protein AO353_29105 [Pseudomonas fluorescens]PMZ05633.1 DUF3087 domain-containing protein [Pseudomonas sp. FW306-02-F02-AB]PMZ11202.1 DUF3087 domain-containing protein [Pseudomonas sp. FW306-02-H06C]PMZ17157.1 DUF3087 domain-containing protein [Pseudomonas sp. FW306-02-F02-AA]PMZ23403.1 DUF3087 domain-containing protein [Pseudomonas sp. FW306-02-F08-AA]